MRYQEVETGREKSDEEPMIPKLSMRVDPRRRSTEEKPCPVPTCTKPPSVAVQVGNLKGPRAIPT